MDPATDAFVAEAQAFCAFVDRAHTLDLPVRLATARVRLLALYSAAVALPDTDSDDDDSEGFAPARPDSWPGFGDVDPYWEVFDPYVLDEPVGGSLSDDVLDIYRDVGEGLALWTAGRCEAAVGHWRFLLDAHWGDHAIDALRALHRACKNVTA